MQTQKETRRIRRSLSHRAAERACARAEFSEKRTRRAGFVDDRTAIREEIEAMHDSMKRGEEIYATIFDGPGFTATADDPPQEPPVDSPDWDDEPEVEFAAQDYL